MPPPRWMVRGLPMGLDATDRAHVVDRGSSRLRVLASALAFAADFAALEASVPTVSIAGRWRRQVTMDSIDATPRPVEIDRRNVPGPHCGRFPMSDKPTGCV